MTGPFQVDPSLQKFIAKPDSYYLYLCGKEGNETIRARHWLWAKICMIFGRSAYKLETIASLLNRNIGVYNSVLTALKGRVRQHEMKTGKEIVAHNILFPEQIVIPDAPLDEVPTPSLKDTSYSLREILPRNKPQASFIKNGAFYYSTGEEQPGWRAVQTCLSTLLAGNVGIPLKILRDKFCSRAFLAKLFDAVKTQKLRQIQQNPLRQRKKEALAGVQSDQCFPSEKTEEISLFTAQMILYHYGCDSDLVALNQIPKNQEIPSSLLEETSDFYNFRNKLIEHFNQQNPPSVLVSDGTNVFNIVGIEEYKYIPSSAVMNQFGRLQEAEEGTSTTETRKTGDLTLWLADPRVDPKKDPHKGLFSITIGMRERLPHTEIALSEADLRDKGYTRAENLQFSDKPWLALFPKKTSH